MPLSDCLRATLFVALMLVAGCGTLPQPFRNDGSDRTVYRLLAPGADSSLRIEAPEGLEPEIGDALARAIAARLIEMEIPASSLLSAQTAHAVRGEARLTAGQALLRWRIVSPSAALIDEFAGAYDARLLASPTGIKALAADIANQISELTTDLRRKTLPLEVPKIALGPITGAPGDGATALATALKDSLRRNQISVADDLNPEHHVIVCDVSVVEPPRGVGSPAQQLVTISWRLLKPDGSEVGAVTQRNLIPRGSLDRRWGRTAEAAGEGGAEGLILMLQELQNKGG